MYFFRPTAWDSLFGTLWLFKLLLFWSSSLQTNHRNNPIYRKKLQDLIDRGQQLQEKQEQDDKRS